MENRSDSPSRSKMKRARAERSSELEPRIRELKTEAPRLKGDSSRVIPTFPEYRRCFKAAVKLTALFELQMQSRRNPRAASSSAACGSTKFFTLLYVCLPRVRRDP